MPMSVSARMTAVATDVTTTAIATAVSAVTASVSTGGPPPMPLGGHSNYSNSSDTQRRRRVVASLARDTALLYRPR